MWVCSYGVPECPICKRAREENEAATRAKEIMDRVNRGLVNGSITVKIDQRTGKVIFSGIPQADRQAGANDECILRALQIKGSALALAKVAQAQKLSGRATLKIG